MLYVNGMSMMIAEGDALSERRESRLTKDADSTAGKWLYRKYL
jgi:hypothetical protein